MKNRSIFSRDEATLYERVSVRRSVRRSVMLSVTLSLFGLLGATDAVYTALFMFESYRAGYVKETYFANSLILYGSLKAKVAINLQKRAILGHFLENFAISAVFLDVRLVQDTYVGQQLWGYRESYWPK